MKTILVSAADQKYFPLLEGLLLSIKDIVEPRNIEVGIYDVGLSKQQQAQIKDSGATVVCPEWDYSVSHFRRAPSTSHKAMLARPHVPRYFPSRDVYLWLDADCWVQDHASIDCLIRSAMDRQFAIVQETHSAYRTPPKVPSLERLYHQRQTEIYFGTDVAQMLRNHVTINSGVFAASYDAPHWEAWHQQLGKAVSRTTQESFYIEQKALNAAIHLCGLESVLLLPAWCNWICSKALPLVSRDGKALLESSPPFRTLGIVHLAGIEKKDREFTLVTADGSPVSRTLLYPRETCHEVPPGA